MIPYGWGYFPGNQCLIKMNYAIEPLSDRYTVYIKDKKKFSGLKKRFEGLKSKYKTQNTIIRKSYQDGYNEIISLNFWKEYLK